MSATYDVKLAVYVIIPVEAASAETAQGQVTDKMIYTYLDAEEFRVYEGSWKGTPLRVYPLDPLPENLDYVQVLAKESELASEPVEDV
jgi:hypothetical protein